MFAFVSAFPKSLHCTDEAQQAETVLSAVLSITLPLLRAGEIPVFPRLPCCSIQPTVADTISCHVVYGLTTNY